MANNYQPSAVFDSVFQIDYDQLYKEGKRILIFDLDNTLISYRELTPSAELVDLGKKLILMGFSTYILSNNHFSRLRQFIMSFPITDYGIHMGKPGIKKVKKYLKEKGLNDLDKIVFIGDQLVTDILCANRLGVYSILVKSIDRSSEHFYTRINRLRDKRIVKRMAKTNLDLAKQVEENVNKGDAKWLNV